MFQQTLADDTPAPKYIPPLPKPAVVKPVSAPPPVFQIQRLISPGPVKRYVLTQPEYTKPAQPWPVYYSALPPKRIVEATQADLKNENRPGVTSFIHRAKHVSVKELAHSLGRKFAMNQVINVSRQKNKTNALLVIIPEEKTGQLIITTSSRNVDEIKRLISEIDRKPKQFLIDAIIRTTGSDGKKTVVRPQIITLEGQSATIQIGNTDGSSIELQINVRELTQPQHASPSAKKASAENVYPHPMAAVPIPTPFELIYQKPSPTEVKRALLRASFEPIHQPRSEKKKKKQTDREKEIQQALVKQISLHFEDAWLIDVCKHIAKLTNINIVIDNMGLEEEGLTAKTKVSIDVDGIRLKSALSNLLKPKHLAYKIEDEVLKITSKNRAQGTLSTVTYPVDHLMVTSSPDHAAVSFETLINLVTSLVEPDSWAEYGGQAVIKKYEKTLSLVIRQTNQGHEKIGKLLDSLRKHKVTGEE
jgi:type II secretory pathway component GspD/PulD (secretin)